MESGPLAKASGGTPGAAHGGAAPVPRMVDHEVLEGLRRAWWTTKYSKGYFPLLEVPLLSPHF